jgi:plasmid maintenance system antidote protein VapI
MISTGQRILSAASAPMAAEVNDLEVAERVAKVMECCGDLTQTAFANRLGVSLPRINYVMRGGPLGKDMAFKMVQVLPGLTTDWLWFGNPAGLPLELAQRLGAVSVGSHRKS